jgi:hypothetical protein
MLLLPLFDGSVLWDGENEENTGSNTYIEVGDVYASHEVEFGNQDIRFWHVGEGRSGRMGETRLALVLLKAQGIDDGRMPEDQRLVDIWTWREEGYLWQKAVLPCWCLFHGQLSVVCYQITSLYRDGATRIYRVLTDFHSENCRYHGSRLLVGNLFSDRTEAGKTGVPEAKEQATVAISFLRMYVSVTRGFECHGSRHLMKESMYLQWNITFRLYSRVSSLVPRVWTAV